MKFVVVLFTAISGLQIPFLQGVIKSVYDKYETPPAKLTLARRRTEVSERDVLLHLEKSLVVQCGSVRIANGDCMCDDRLKEVLIIQVDDSRAAVYWHDAAKELVVAFRQTTTIDEWIVNLASQQVPLPGFNGTKVHEGFLDQLEKIDDAVYAEILERATRRELQDYTLVISGYSMGGAMATLFAAKYANKLPKFRRTRIYTYASPRVGNQAFAQLIDSLPFPVIRYTIQEDIVALLPLAP
ncbi:hypothetical protein DSO57_1019995 [Entomophthora muscae]|uniref:Uncharacterized protein n=1 Tax=Entomophthora muscae TaxID=34485 RepID=A0ACC2SSN2_9FUNG|nr:hypothetical protein DSO57_1019995 [Entomophthora muscae]